MNQIPSNIEKKDPVEVKTSGRRFWLRYLYIIIIMFLTSMVPYIISEDYHLVPYVILVLLAYIWPFTPKPEFEVTNSGWVVEDKAFFELITKNRPPRPFTYIEQLKIDAKHWKPLLVWGVALGAIISGIIQNHISFIIFGIIVLIDFGRKLLEVVADYKKMPLMYGDIHEIDERHESFKDMVVSELHLEAGEKVFVTTHIETLEYLLSKYHQVQVAFLYNRQAKYQPTIGLKPVL